MFTLEFTVYVFKCTSQILYLLVKNKNKNRIHSFYATTSELLIYWFHLLVKESNPRNKAAGYKHQWKLDLMKHRLSLRAPKGPWGSWAGVATIRTWRNVSWRKVRNPKKKKKPLVSLTGSFLLLTTERVLL